MNPPNWTSIRIEATDEGAAPKSRFLWTAVDETTGGRVRFWMSVDIDAETPADVPEDAWHRMLCVYIVGHLSGKALSDAYQSLADTLSWQRQQARPVPQITEGRRHAVSKVRRVERTPFVFDDF